MTIKEIATLTGYTPRLIQLECKAGRLTATMTSKRAGWTISKPDYIAWRKPYKGRGS